MGSGLRISQGLWHLPQTQAEIRKEEKSKVSQAHNEDTESPIHSWYPNAALEKTLGKEPDQLQSPVNLFNKRENGPEPSSISSSSCKTGKSTSSIFTNSSGGSVKHVDDAKSLDSSASHTPSVPTTQFKNESVHFEDQSVAFSFSSRSSSPRTANERSNPSETPFSHNSSKPSPYPTPLKLSDDMQTPGTDFPSYVYDNESGKNKRIRSQFKAPKLWGGNGIPNTTTKYKEDLKVSWHATAFEQRLEMALLEDHCIPKRKELGETPPIDY